MANDYGYFGNGSTGYAHYKQSFDRNFGSSGGNRNSGGNGSGCGPLLLIVVVVVVAALVLWAM